MTDGTIIVRSGGATGAMRPATEADFAYVNGHLRAWDKFEQDHFRVACGIEKVDTLDMMEKAWTLLIGGDIVGYVALQLPPKVGKMSTNRFIPMLSTEHVTAHWMDFARLSRVVLGRVMDAAPKWVTDFYSLPLAKYEATVRWHEKTMGWHRVNAFDIFGEQAILFHKPRKEKR